MTKYVPSLVKIHWRMLILECSQGCYRVKIRPCDLDLWPWKSIGFQILLRTRYVPSLIKIHWRMLILECSQGCYGRTDGRTEGLTVALLYPFATSLARIIKQQWKIEEISIFSNSSHLEWRAELWDTILKWDYPRTIPAKSGLIWLSGFREEDLNVIFYQNMHNLHHRHKSAERKIWKKNPEYNVKLLLAT